MKEKIKKVFETAVAAKWWNPLFWAWIITLPVLTASVMLVYGALVSMVAGYERGSHSVSKKLNKLLATIE